MVNRDLTIIGGGLIGLATAYQALKTNPNLRVIIIEKESDVAKHQSGRNSGVIHTGIYYKPGSLKAQNCREGKVALQEFCAEHNIHFKITGKIIAACDESEVATLNELYRRGQANGVKCKIIGPAEIKEIEPHLAAIKGIYVPETGIIDYKQMAQKLRQLISEQGGEISVNCKLFKCKKNSNRITLITSKEEIETKYVINCAGLYSDTVAGILGFKSDLKIIPFRGEYYDLKKEYNHLCRTLIYPVPNMNFPFLGVHFTRRLDFLGHDSGVECGPNAVLAFAKEGYKKTDVNPVELLQSLSYPGFLRLAKKYWREGSDEILRSYSKSLFTKALQRLIPEVTEEHLTTGGSGVRAQAIRSNGTLVDDFEIVADGNIINVLNAPSPGATSCLNIGTYINSLLQSRI